MGVCLQHSISIHHSTSCQSQLLTVKLYLTRALNQTFLICRQWWEMAPRMALHVRTSAISFEVFVAPNSRRGPLPVRLVVTLRQVHLAQRWRNSSESNRKGICFLAHFSCMSLSLEHVEPPLPQSEAVRAAWEEKLISDVLCQALCNMLFPLETNIVNWLTSSPLL